MDKNHGGQRQMRELDPAQIYRHTPQRADIWCLSPYEFGMYWDVVPLKTPHMRLEQASHPRIGHGS